RHRACASVLEASARAPDLGACFVLVDWDALEPEPDVLEALRRLARRQQVVLYAAQKSDPAAAFSDHAELLTITEKPVKLRPLLRILKTSRASVETPQKDPGDWIDAHRARFAEKPLSILVAED